MNSDIPLLTSERKETSADPAHLKIPLISLVEIFTTIKRVEYLDLAVKALDPTYLYELHILKNEFYN